MPTRVHINPVTDLEVIDLGADGFDDPGRVKSENGRQLGQRALREPFDPVG